MIYWIKKTFKSFYQELVLTNDSPQSIALGFGLGVFLGILPFTGVVAAMAMAWFFRLNKTAAILGSVLTNTWLGFVVLGISIDLSCRVLRLNDYDIQIKFQQLVKDFRWANFMDVSIVKLIGAVALGYLIVSIFLSLLAYGVCLGAIYYKRLLR